MSLLTLLFGGCAHPRISWPVRLKRGEPPQVSCLECGRTFSYDWRAMQVIEEIRKAPEHREAVPEAWR